MTVKILQAAAYRVPFRPFTICMANGERIRVADQHRVGVHPEGNSVMIFKRDGGYLILNIPLIAKVITN